MKLVILIMATCILQVAAKNSFAQSFTYVKNGVTIKQIFKEITKRTGYELLYADRDVNDTKKINANFKETPLISVIEKCLENQSLTYTIEGKGVMIKAKSKPSTLNRLVANLNAIEVSGRIIDSLGKPLPGAVVRIKSTGRAVSTDENGRFTIPNVEEGAILVISYTGYTNKEVRALERMGNIVLELSLSELDEVAVVAYGVQKKESLVGAISTVKVNDLKIPTRSLSNAIGGRVAGVVSVQRSGEPGQDDASFWIRGIGTFGAGSNPLIIVDGVERSLSNIEPEEIESFSVLKDASATAVYGIRGANGVVLINTRRGKQDKPTTSFKIESGITGATRLPKLARAVNVYELYNEANLNTNPDFITPYTPEILELYKNQSDPDLYPDVDWMGLMMNNWSNNMRANLNITGGSEMAKYFVSGTFYNENGIWKEDDLNKFKTNAALKRYNFRSNVDLRLGKTTDIGIGLGGILVTQNFPGKSSDNIWRFLLATNPGDYQPTYINPATGERVFGGSGNMAIRNPYADLVNTGYQTTWNNSIQSTLTLKQDLEGILKGLKAQGMFAFDVYNYHNIQRTRDWGDMYRPVGRDSNGDLILNRYYEGQQDLSYSKQSSGNRRLYLQANLNYDRTFGDHKLNGLLLYNQQDFVNADAGSSIAALPFRMQGVVGRLSYGFKNRYFAELSAGYNGSENFKKGRRFGLFPSLGLGWIASEEQFFEGAKNWISFLKFRGSYGLKGNDQIGGRRFAYLTTVGGGNGSYKFGIDGGNAYNGTGEDEWGVDLTWEKEHEVNLGMEMRFLNGFNFQLDVFKRKRSGIFMQRSALPEILGITKTPWGNIGIMENKGIDASLEYNKKVGEVDISFKGNFTFVRNKIINNDQPYSKYKYQSQIGQRYYQPFGLMAERLYEDGDFIDLNNFALQPYLATPKFGNTVKPGDIKYTDVNGDGLLDAYDAVPIGNPNFPEILFGFGTSIGYKGFDLSVFFQGTANMDFMVGGMGFFPFYDNLGRSSIMQYATDRWTTEQPNQNVLFPRLSYGTNPNNYYSSTWWQKDASYLRLKSAEIGYTLPKSLVNKIKISNLRIYASGINLITWSKFKLWDPELGSENGARYPIQRNFNLGVNLQF